MYGPQFLEGVRSFVRGSGEVAPALDAAWTEITGHGEPSPPRQPHGARIAATPGLLVLRSPPVAWEDHATLAGDPALVRVLRASAAPPALLLPIPDGAEAEACPDMLRQGLARSLAALWQDERADDSQRREVVSAARDANRFGRRLRRLLDDAGPALTRRGAGA